MSWAFLVQRRSTACAVAYLESRMCRGPKRTKKRPHVDCAQSLFDGDVREDLETARSNAISTHWRSRDLFSTNSNNFLTSR